MYRTYSLSAYTRQKFGQRVQKIPLDVGFSCPNRDGTLSRKGCIFCNPIGSGTAFRDKGMTIPEQWQFWHEIHTRKHGLKLFSAYLQSYSNTHGPIEKLQGVLEGLHGLPGLTGLSLGTRPDCLDNAKLDLLAEQKDALGLAEITLELGLQSANNTTLAHINRGHTVEEFTEAVHAANQRGILVVAHVMAGLPTPAGREGRKEMLETVECINALPIHGVKFHNLFVCRETPLAKDYEAGNYTPMEQIEYLDDLSHALMHLRPSMVVHRLNGNPAEGELLAPDWAANLRGLHNQVRAFLKEHEIWQGKLNGAEDGPAEWNSPDFKGVVE